MGGRKDIRFCPGSRVFGTSFEATHWRSLDVCGCFGVTATLCVHLFAYITIAINLIEGSMLSTALFLLVYTPVAGLAISSLYMAWSTDPGAVPLGARPLVTVRRAGSREDQASANSRQRALRRCHKCNDNFKPNRAHHDSVTGRCIVKFDHFCPWVGNAVGALNHKFFVLFVGYTMCSCILSLVMLLVRAMYCGWTTDDLARGADQQRLLTAPYRDECYGFYNSYATLGLMIIAVIFMIFTCCMLFEQIEAIETNSSKIARMKMRVGHTGTELARVTEEFNEMFGGTSSEVAWHWFLPFEVEFPRGMKKVVLGYEWDETFDSVPYEEPSGSHSSTMTVGGAGADEELGAVELTSSISSAATTFGASEEASEKDETFEGMPPVPEKQPHLIQRASSGSRLKSAIGSMA